MIVPAIRPRPRRCSARYFSRNSDTGASGAALRTERRTKWPVPAASAASINAMLPSPSTTRAPAAPGPPKPVIADTTVSAPASAGTSVPGSDTSAMTASTRSRSESGIRAGSRASTRTGSPRSTRRMASSRPMRPVPPAMTIIVPLLPRCPASPGGSVRPPRSHPGGRAPCRSGCSRSAPPRSRS